MKKRPAASSGPTEAEIVAAVRKLAVKCDVCSRSKMPGMDCPFCAKDDEPHTKKRPKVR